MKRYRSMASVHQALGTDAKPGTCANCDREVTVYPWPLPGLGEHCASCVVILSRPNKTA